MFEVPTAIARNAVAAWGEPGRRWLAELPGLVVDVCRIWSLELGDPYPVSFHWVSRVRRADGTRAMARELVPSHDPEATAATIGVLRRLHAADVVEGLPDVATLGQDFARHLGTDAGRDVLPRAFVRRAAQLLDDPCASAPRRVVLHGDLHHDNVLRGGDGWVAIDPHGMVGDPGFDIGPLLYNPDTERPDDLLALVPLRVEQLADGLDLPLDRAVTWGFVAAVLSEVWDAGSDDYAGGPVLAVAELLVRRLP